MRGLAGEAGSVLRLGSAALTLSLAGASGPSAFAGAVTDGGAAGGAGGSLTVDAPAGLLLSGPNSFTGGVVLKGGVLELGSPTAAGVGHALAFAGSALLRLDPTAFTAGAFGTALTGFDAGDRIDLPGLAWSAGATAAYDGTTLTVRSGSGSVSLRIAGPAAAGGFSLSDDGAGHVLVGAAAGAAAAAMPGGVAVLGHNLLGLENAGSGASTALVLQAQAVVALAAKVEAGVLSLAAAQQQVLHLVDGTVGVAEISYGFFTGATPTAAGLAYLTNSTANGTDLNDGYYAGFSTERRFINFAVNLATGPGQGAAAFQANYGALSLADATAKAYAAVFGFAPAAGKVDAILGEAVPDGRGGAESRAQYLSELTGGSAAAQKAAVVGFLLADAVKEGIGPWQAAGAHFLQDLAHGTAAYGVDLLAAYSPAPALVGQPVLLGAQG